ncbi:MAG: hypothetical protein A2Z79_06580 [Deltaproteobacteria bacterium GWA2_55_82]|nr:MAG: hypothetical protein A2Z79_06580 [Deltaproteobacteria bacterium GWA2_55_82]
MFNVSQWYLKSVALQAKTSSASNEIFKLTSYARLKARCQLEAMVEAMDIPGPPLSPFRKGEKFSRLFFEPAAFQAVVVQF